MISYSNKLVIHWNVYKDREAIMSQVLVTHDSGATYFVFIFHRAGGILFFFSYPGLTNRFLKPGKLW